MAAPSVRATGAATSTTTTTSVTINKPTGTTSGDLLIAVVANGGASSAPSTVPSGWTLLDSATVTTGVTSPFWGGLYYLVAGGSEPSSYTWSGFTDSCTGCMIAVQGADTGSPFDAHTVQSNVDPATGTAGITTTVADTLIVAAEAADDNRAMGPPSAAWACATDPTTLTEQIEQLSSGGADTGSGIAAASKAVAGATGAFTVGFNGGADNVGFLLAVKPAAGATNINVSDSGAGSEVASVSATVPLTEVGAATDDTAVAASVPLSESASASDSIAVAIPVPVSDSGAGSDALTATAAVPLADAGSATDSLAASATVTLGESGVGSDSIAVSVPKSLSDSGSGSETVTTAVSAALADAAAATEQIALAALVAATETGTATDAISIQVSVPGQRPGVLRTSTGPAAGLSTTTSHVGQLTTVVST